MRQRPVCTWMLILRAVLPKVYQLVNQSNRWAEFQARLADSPSTSTSSYNTIARLRNRKSQTSATHTNRRAPICHVRCLVRSRANFDTINSPHSFLNMGCLLWRAGIFLSILKSSTILNYRKNSVNVSIKHFTGKSHDRF